MTELEILRLRSDGTYTHSLRDGAMVLYQAQAERWTLVTARGEPWQTAKLQNMRTFPARLHEALASPPEPILGLELRLSSDLPLGPPRGPLMLCFEIEDVGACFERSSRDRSAEVALSTR